MIHTILAQSATAITAPTGSHSLSWFVVGFCIVLGMLVALNPSRRATEIKRTKE